MNVSLSPILHFICELPQYADNFLLAIDVGAHHGQFSNSLISSKLFNKVISFEPNPETYRHLVKNVHSTLTCDFEAINSALGVQPSSLDLYSDEDTATASLLPYALDYNNKGMIKTSTVAVHTLNQYLNKLGSSKLIFLKIDTQGNDLDVIKGGEELILAYRPIISTEFIYISMYEGQCSPEQLSETLSLLKYKMYSLYNLHVTPEGRLAFCDAIFIPEELVIPITQKYDCIDNSTSLQHQIDILNRICSERLDLINLLDAKCRRRSIFESKMRSFRKLKSKIGI